jgi:hypothetical protein
MKSKALSRDDRKRQILIAFAVEMQKLTKAEIEAGTAVEMTVADIARCLHLSPSTKLRDMILELVIDGTLDYRDEPIPGIAKFRRLYSPDNATFKRPKAQYGRSGREIKINSRQGSFLAQLDQ